LELAAAKFKDLEANCNKRAEKGVESVSSEALKQQEIKKLRAS
jgi:hypothetical protein